MLTHNFAMYNCCHLERHYILNLDLTWLVLYNLRAFMRKESQCYNRNLKSPNLVR